MLIPAALFISALIAGDTPVSLRRGCESSDPVVATVSGGTSVTILMALTSSAGKCYKISIGEVRGYVAASALVQTELFEVSVRTAPVLTGGVKRQTTPAKRAGSAGNNNSLVEATRLINDQQPKAALELLQPGIMTAGYDQLVLAGVAARAADDPRTALDYLEKALRIRPDHAVEQLAAAVRKELSADRSSERLAATRFLLRYEDGALDADTAREVIALLEQEYSRISAELGCRTDERIATIVQSAQAYRASSEAAEWSGGYFDGHRIRIPAAGGKGISPATRNALSHELVHACLVRLGDWPAWLHEGLAMKLTGHTASVAQRQKVQSLVRQGKLPRLDNVSQTWTRMNAEAASNAYLYSLLAVEGLYDMHRSTGITAVLRNPELLPRLSAELDKRMIQ